MYPDKSLGYHMGCESRARGVVSEMNAYGIRCENDVRIAEDLLNDVLVKKTMENLDRMTEKGPTGVRRRLVPPV